MKMLPMDVVRIIRSFMTFRERSQMINKQWIKEVFYKGIKLGKWKSKRRLYTYMKLFGSCSVNMSWETFCKRMLHRKRRVRDQRDQLTWRAVAMSEMEQKNVCQSCGKNTRSNVFGVHLCPRCRACSRKKFAYMVNVQTAISFGIPRRILKEIPVYYGGCGKYRFWHEIQELLRDLN